MEVRLDGPQGPSGDARDLLERALGEEAQGDDLAVGLVEAGHGIPHRSLVLAAEGEALRIGGPSRGQGLEPLVAVLAADGSDQGDGLAASHLTEGKTNGEP